MTLMIQLQELYIQILEVLQSPNMANAGNEQYIMSPWCLK